ncbi:hypothetical protein ABFS82_04G135000 [Erythranthe guttata]|uniref:Piwi domain-containing protein n=1 Tax=Erythranthe guttata TaxID=4155 RepID=A0A022RJQ7_ERYGU|nr:PREDICTED: protein argonaute 5-like [Erythranthe guttata]EYU40234.1 hypothetical protein MIMGU_mgv1a022215mg [Erythranthe guttata]|eukprot:XP_012834050.1 PREDICTED: protein argonaute 5-like [Erythranthe guttata]
MSGIGREERGRSRAAGGRGPQQPTGRGKKQPSRGGGPGRGRGRGSSATPEHSISAFVALFEQSPMEQKLTFQASSSTTVPAPRPQVTAVLAVNPPQGPSKKALTIPARPGFGSLGQKTIVKANNFLVPVTKPPAPTPQPQAPAVIPQQGQLPPASTKAVRLPARPGLGSFGQKTIVKANHFLVAVADRDLNHYDVAISPEVTSKKVCRMIMDELVKSFNASNLGKRQLAYDGRKNCYTAGPLPFVSKEFAVTLDQDSGFRKEREFKVSIKFASKADLHYLKEFLQGRQLDNNPNETIQCLDVVLRSKPYNNSYEAVGRSFFHWDFGSGKLGDGLDYWKGFYQSLRPTQMGLSLNIDMSARAFIEPIYVSEFVFKYLNLRDRNRPLSDQDRIKVKRALKGVKVESIYLKYTKRFNITGVSTEPTESLMFTIDASGAQISVSEFFRQQHSIVLMYPRLPAIQSGIGRPIYIPMELCKIVEGQRYSRKLNGRQVTALLQATCERPAKREGVIRTMVERNNYNHDELVNREFSIQIRPELMSVEARVLPPPMLKYHDSGRENRVQPNEGQWNMMNKKMINGGKVDFWTCVNFSRSKDHVVKRFINELVTKCLSRGMEFSPHPLVPIRTKPSNQIEKSLIGIHSDCLKTRKQLQLLLIILPDGNVTDSYGLIKRVCETELGFVSQCCQPQHVLKCNNHQYLENVSLKINVKVGGRNTVLEKALCRTIPFVSDMPTIIFGADVTHPQPGDESSPSIAAVVASMDWPEVSKYRGLVSAQGHRDEIIQDLYINKDSGMIREHLVAFYQNTKLKPSRLIFYRDGVSEGQFNQVLLYEVDAIRKACNELQTDYQPRITFVVVQKKHHTRLFPADHTSPNTTDKSDNILPGTVVDTKICHPNQLSFYLCSHAGIQGTSHPAHYHVLFDENKFSADSMQMLTYSLCYTYARCTRSVSIVPPAYYAHLAAFRARYYIEAGGDLSDSGSAAAGPDGVMRERVREVRALPAIMDNVKDVMFYC